MKKYMVALLAALFGMVSSQELHAWTYYVTNNTNFRAVVTLKYPLCRDDRREVQPGKTVKVSSGACLLTRIDAEIEEGGEIYVGNRVYRTTDTTTGRHTIVQAEPYKAPAGSTFENYHIAGPAIVPVMERGEQKLDPQGNPLYKSRYTISRTVQ